MQRIAARGITVDFNPAGGLLDRVEFDVGGRKLTPMHRAPWIGNDEPFDPDVDQHLKVLAGDFFCAPFGASDVEAGPAHGWPANGNWRSEGQTEADQRITARFRLDHPVMGGSVVKEIALRTGQPIVYQRHTLEGGSGSIPLAHHAMLHVPGGVRLSFSSKAFGATPDQPLETDPLRGRSLLRYPQRLASLSALELADGGTVDARSYPFATGHEDLLQLFDAPGVRIGWTAALASNDGFLFFALKDAQLLNSTVLWLSNGGRFYPPWNGRHTAVLGLEEACTFFGNGHRASSSPNPLNAEGISTAVALDPAHPTVVRYAFGAVPAPSGWTEVRDIALTGERLTITDIGGDTVAVPFDPEFFREIGP